MTSVGTSAYPHEEVAFGVDVFAISVLLSCDFVIRVIAVGHENVRAVGRDAGEGDEFASPFFDRISVGQLGDKRHSIIFEVIVVGRTGRLAQCARGKRESGGRGEEIVVEFGGRFNRPDQLFSFGFSPRNFAEVGRQAAKRGAGRRPKDMARMTRAGQT